RAAARFEHRHARACFAVLGQRATCLPHEPDRESVDRFAAAGAKEVAHSSILARRRGTRLAASGARGGGGDRVVCEGSAVERHVVVIGGGISGLAAAYYLRAG